MTIVWLIKDRCYRLGGGNEEEKFWRRFNSRIESSWYIKAGTLEARGMTLGLTKELISCSESPSGFRPKDSVEGLGGFGKVGWGSPNW